MKEMGCSDFLLKVGHWFYVNTRFGRWYFNRNLTKSEQQFPCGHSATTQLEFNDLIVCIIPYSFDNYGFIVWRTGNSRCIIIDPGHFPPFSNILSINQLELESVLITHKHYDHCGAVDAIKTLYPHVKIYANILEKIKACTDPISEPRIKFCACVGEVPIDVVAYHTPGHTIGHTTYTIDTIGTDQSSASILVFSGDFIFMGSIGAIFEGSVKEYINSLDNFLQSLLSLKVPADNIHIFPGHEYSMSNMQFIVYHCTPFSTYARKKLSWCEEQREWLLPTIPMTLFEELSYSPYLRIAIATLPHMPKIEMICKTEGSNELKRYYMPHIVEILHEIMLSEKFISSNLVGVTFELNFLKEKIYEDLFSSDGKKVLMRCEHCAPEPFTSRLDESNLPGTCKEINEGDDSKIIVSEPHLPQQEN